MHFFVPRSKLRQLEIPRKKKKGPCDVSLLNLLVQETRSYDFRDKSFLGATYKWDGVSMSTLFDFGPYHLVSLCDCLTRDLKVSDPLNPVYF